MYSCIWKNVLTSFIVAVSMVKALAHKTYGTRLSKHTELLRSVTDWSQSTTLSDPDELEPGRAYADIELTELLYNASLVDASPLSGRRPWEDLLQQHENRITRALQKRTTVDQTLRMLYHFTCPIAGLRGRYFKLHGSVNRETEFVTWSDLVNIESVDQVDRDGINPITFTTKFQHRSCIAFEEVVCHYHFVGHIEGQIYMHQSMWFLSLQLLDTHTHPINRRPYVAETCYYRIPDERQVCPDGLLILARESICRVSWTDGWMPHDVDLSSFTDLSI